MNDKNVYYYLPYPYIYLKLDKKEFMKFFRFKTQIYENWTF